MRNLSAGFVFFWAGACLAQSPAPSLLSRSAEPVNTRPAATNFQSSLGVLSGYDSGPAAAGDREDGPFEEITGALDATRFGRAGEFRLHYGFELRHYTETSRLDRSSHSFDLGTRLFLSRRVTLALRDVGSSSTFGGPFDPAPAAGAGSFFEAGPEVLNSRTLANTAMADLVFAPSARTSFSVGGDGFLIERQFQGLVDATGWRGRADLAHRYSRRRTVALSYSFTHFDHTHSFGGADYAVYALGHSWRLGRSAELNLLAGAGQLRSAGIRGVVLDPEIARLLGVPRGAEIFRLRTWTPHARVAWIQGIGRGELRLEAARLISDGGGLSGLARQNIGSLSLSTPRRRAWRASAVLLFRTYRSLDTLLYQNTMALAGGTLTRSIGPRLEAIFRYQFAFYNFQQGLLQNFRRHQIAAGIQYRLDREHGSQ